MMPLGQELTGRQLQAAHDLEKIDQGNVRFWEWRQTLGTAEMGAKSNVRFQEMRLKALPNSEGYLDKYQALF